MIPLRLADLRNLTDAELRRHIFDRYMVPTELLADPTDDELAQRIGTVLVAYESVGDYGCDYGCDSSAYFLVERDGELYEVHGSHDSTCGFEGQWEPRPVTPSYLVSEHWRMLAGGYDEHRESGRPCGECNGAGYLVDGRTLDISRICSACDGSGRVHDPEQPGDLSTRDVVMLWLHHRFSGELAEQPFVLPEWAIPTWARHVDKQGNAVDLRVVDDRYLLSALGWASRELRRVRHADYVYTLIGRDGARQQVRLPCVHSVADIVRAVEEQAVGITAVADGQDVFVFDAQTGEQCSIYTPARDVVFTFRGKRTGGSPARGSFVNAMREAESRGLLPTWDELRIAGDVAELRGAMVYRPIAADEVACVPIESGPWDLVDLWVGYKLLACSDASG